MAKRDFSKLVEYLNRQSATEFYMTFDEIEALTGQLPLSAKKYNQWWENGKEAINKPQRSAILKTPYNTFYSPNVGKVRFVRRS